MKFLTTTETGKKWNLSARRVGVLCSEGRIPDVQKTGNTWLIPENAEKPIQKQQTCLNGLLLLYVIIKMQVFRFMVAFSKSAGYMK